VRRVFAAFAVVLALGASAAAGADTDTDAERVLRLARFPVEIHYEAHNDRVAEKVRSVCDRDLPVLTRELGMDAMRPIEIRVEDDITPYRRSLGSSLPEWGVAFAVMEEQVIVVDVKRATRAWNSLDQVIPHELSHLLIAQRVPLVHFPIWFLEGLAQWQAGEWSMVDSWQLMNSVWGNDTPRLWQLVDSYPTYEAQARTAYRISYAAFTGLFDDGIHHLPEFLDAVKRYASFDQAFDDYFGVDVNTFALEFHHDLQQRYRSRLLFFQDGPLFSALAVIFLLVGLRFYLIKRRRLRDMDAPPGPTPL